MRDNNHGNRKQSDTGINTKTATPVDTAEQRATVRQGLRILARIIARTHLRRQPNQCRAMPEATKGRRTGAAPHGPPPEREARG